SQGEAGSISPRPSARTVSSKGPARMPAATRGTARVTRARPTSAASAAGPARLARPLLRIILPVAAVIVIAGVGVVVLRMLLHVDLGQDDSRQVRPGLQRVLDAGQRRFAPRLLPAHD